MDRRSYLEIISGQIRCKMALPLVMEELEAHIEDQKQDFMAEGMTEREAEEAAVREMGDPVEVGVEMDRIHRPRMNWPMLAWIFLFHVCGMALLVYLDAKVAVKGMPFLGNPAMHLFYLAAGFVLLLAVCMIDYTRIARRAKPLLLLYCAALILIRFFFVMQINGAVYYEFLGMSLNTRLLPLLAVPLYCAVLYSFRGEKLRGFLRAVCWLIPVVCCAAVVSFSSLEILVPVFAVVLTAAVIKGYFRVPVRRTLAGIWGTAVLIPAAQLLLILKFGAEYQRMRLAVMIRPGKYAESAGYQFYNLRRLLGQSRLIGAGADVSSVSGNIPENSSYVLAYVAAYFGILAAAALAVVILMLFVRLTQTVLRQRNQLGMLMGLGCGAVFFVQFVWYLMLNLGIVVAPFAYCPFLTYGGTGILVSDILLGLMLSIYRYQSVTKAYVPRRAGYKAAVSYWSRSEQ